MPENTGENSIPIEGEKIEKGVSPEIKAVMKKVKDIYDYGVAYKGLYWIDTRTLSSILTDGLLTRQYIPIINKNEK